MKTKSILTLMVVMAAVMTAHAGWMIEQIATDPRGKQSTQVFYIQENKIMIEDQEKVIFDLETLEIVAIMADQGMYMKFPADMMNMMGKAAPEWSGTLEVVKTSETETIAGYSTTKYQLLIDGGLAQEIWMAEDLDVSAEVDMEQFLNMSTAKAGVASYQSTAEYQDLFRQGYPLRQVVFQAGGKEIIEATKVEQQDIPDSQFEVPDGYQEMNMQQMMQGK